MTSNSNYFYIRKGHNYKNLVGPSIVSQDKYLFSGSFKTLGFSEPHLQDVCPFDSGHETYLGKTKLDFI